VRQTYRRIRKELANTDGGEMSAGKASDRAALLVAKQGMTVAP